MQMGKRTGMAALRRRVELERGLSKGEDLKTAAMYRLERKFGLSIWDLLVASAGPGYVLAKRYGVSKSAISKWRKRLGIKVENSGQFKPIII